MAQPNRRITDEQFSAGTTIDGDRIDRAMEDVVKWGNAVPPRDVRRRFARSAFALGAYRFKSYAAGGSMVPMMNDHNETQVVGTVPINCPTNRRRVKGAINRTSVVGDYLWWEQAVAFDRPCLLDGVWCLLSWDNASFPNTFNWGGAPPAPLGANADVEDVVLQVAIDDPFVPEDRLAAQLLYHRCMQRAEALLPRPHGFAPFVPVPGDMMPASVHANPFYGVQMLWNDRHLSLPVPARARLRFRFGIPRYEAPFDHTTWGAGGLNADQSQFYSAGFTILEATE